MKKRFKIIFSIIMLGWFPFMFLSVWGSWNRTVGLFVLTTGICILFVGCLSFLTFLNNSHFWSTQTELEEAIRKNREETDNYIKARHSLLKAALKFGEESK